MNNLVWSESRCALGVCANLKVEHEKGRIILKGDGGGHGCQITFSREITGNGDWDGVIGDCNGKVSVFTRIEGWSRTPNSLSFILIVWGAHGSGPWLPPGGIRFIVRGRLEAFSSAQEFHEYLKGGYERDMKEHGLAMPDASQAPPSRAGKA